MSALGTALRWDIVLQARNGFYWASAFVVLVVGGLLLTLPAAARSNEAAWVPALLAVNLQLTTFFFVAGLILLERDEGTLAALAVSPLTPSVYLVTHTITLTALAALETIAIILLAFDSAGSWMLVLSGTTTLGVIYTGAGAAVAARYTSVNALLLPASLTVALLLLPLLPHFGLLPRALFLVHPIEPAFTLMRAAYRETSLGEILFGGVGSLAWSAAAFLFGQRGIMRMMRATQATGGR